MQADLKGKAILVTRPAEQSEVLCRLIEENNGKAVRFPTLEIQPPDNDELVIQKFARLSDFDIGIFISKNAVIKTLLHNAFDKSYLNKMNLFAIGAGTANQLNKLDIDHIEFIVGNSGSDDLLQIDGLKTENIRNKKVIIFRGQGGREQLAKVLRERGANVEYVEVYKRTCPGYDKSYIDKIWADGGPDIIIITSAEALNNLFSMLGSDHKNKLLNKQTLTISERLAGEIEKLGFVKKAIIAPHVSDKSLVDALISIVNK